MLSRITLLFFTLFFSFSICEAQKVNEVGAYLGLANYQGDFTQANLELDDTKYAVGVLYRSTSIPKSCGERTQALLG